MDSKLVQSKNKYGIEFDPFKLTGVNVPSKNRSEAMDAVATYLKEEALQSIGSAQSPVSKGPWKKTLTDEYKKIKKEESSSVKPNLELSGDLLDAFEVEAISQKKLFYGINGAGQGGKAEGNNIGSYGRDEDEGKARRFVPLDDENFSDRIIKGMTRILEDFAEEE